MQLSFSHCCILLLTPLLALFQKVLPTQISASESVLSIQSKIIWVCCGPYKQNLKWDFGSESFTSRLGMRTLTLIDVDS